MTVNLSIKNVPESLAEKLRRRAEANHRSLQGELMSLLENAVMMTHVAQAQSTYVVSRNASANAGAPNAAKRSAVLPDETRTLRQIWEEARAKYRSDTTSSVELLREAREERDVQLLNVVDAPDAYARANALLRAAPRAGKPRARAAAGSSKSKLAAAKKGKRA